MLVSPITGFSFSEPRDRLCEPLLLRLYALRPGYPLGVFGFVTVAELVECFRRFRILFQCVEQAFGTTNFFFSFALDDLGGGFTPDSFNRAASRM